MTVEITAPARASASDVLNPRANEAREQIMGSQVFDWVMRGWVFSMGLLVDDTTNIASSTTLADTTPTVVLASPVGGETIVVPLRVTCSIVDDPGGLTTLDLHIMRAKEDVTTAHAFSSGTALTGVQNHLTTFPMIAPKATIEHTVTSSALLVTDAIVIDHKEFPDEGLTAATFAEPGYDYIFVVPHALIGGAALMLTAYAASTASEIRPCFTWAELPASIYQP